MQTYNGKLSLSHRKLVTELVSVRFKEPEKFKTPEALVIYEQKFLAEPLIYSECCLDYNLRLEKPQVSSISKDIVLNYIGKMYLPFKLDLKSKQLHFMILPEYYDEYIEPVYDYEVVKHVVPIYHLVESMQLLGVNPDFLCALTDQDIFKLITTEAIELGASDMTIVPKEKKVIVYYDVRKKKIYSKRLVDRTTSDSLINYIAIQSKAAYKALDRYPKYMSLDLDINHRGRVLINPSYYGDMASIRILSNKLFNKKVSELGLSEPTQRFIEECMKGTAPGLRLIVGRPSSGKNTTTAAILYEINMEDIYKVLSLENPVEMILAGVEQIDVETEEEFERNAASMIRSDADILYLSEFTDRSAKAIMRAINMNIPVFSTIHANSISGVVSRIRDLTGLGYDEIIDGLHSIIFQDLVRDDERDILYPVNRCMFFSRELKESLYGKSFGDIRILLNKAEDNCIS